MRIHLFADYQLAQPYSIVLPDSKQVELYSRNDDSAYLSWPDRNGVNWLVNLSIYEIYRNDRLVGKRRVLSTWSKATWDFNNVPGFEEIYMLQGCVLWRLYHSDGRRIAQARYGYKKKTTELEVPVVFSQSYQQVFPLLMGIFFSEIYARNCM